MARRVRACELVDKGEAASPLVARRVRACELPRWVVTRRGFVARRVRACELVDKGEAASPLVARRVRACELDVLKTERIFVARRVRACERESCRLGCRLQPKKESVEI